MPLYEYACTDPHCDHHWEAEASIKADPERVCPQCHQPTAQRQISRTSFDLQGSGWYAKGGY